MFEQVKELFLEASTLPTAERSELLDRRASDDPELRSAVEELLAEELARVDRFLEGEQ